MTETKNKPELKIKSRVTRIWLTTDQDIREYPMPPQIQSYAARIDYMVQRLKQLEKERMRDGGN